jgi:dihydrofolate reductase
MDLVDEHRLMVNPILLGKGTPLFKAADEPQKLKLTASRTFDNGNVLLTYQSARSA